MERHVKRVGLWCIFVLLLLLNIYVGAFLYAQTRVAETDSSSSYANLELFTRTLELVRNNYVDKEEISYGDLIKSALKGMLSSLDRHTEFMEPEVYDHMQDETRGSFGGLGIVISIRDGVLTVVSTMENTPAFRAGIRAEDRIVAIDGKPTADMDIQEAVENLKGEVDTRVELKIRRGENEVFTREIVRNEIEVDSVKETEILNDSIAYIRLSNFAQTTFKEMREALAELRGKGMEALILDMRNNPGGLLDSAVDVADLFLNANDLIVYTKGRGERRDTYRAKTESVLNESIPIAILVNAGSASGAEIVAGALQDHERAILIGEKTFGKGSVQAVFPVKDGSAVRLTIAKYYTPSERVIHQRGIEPDIVVPVPPSEWTRIRMRQISADNGNGKETEDNAEIEDEQLARAVAVLEGIMLYAERVDQ